MAVSVTKSWVQSYPVKEGQRYISLNPGRLFRSTLRQSRPNKASLKCPSRTCVRMCVHQSDVWSVVTLVFHTDLHFSLTLTLKDIDQLKKTMALTGTPGPTLLAKITSEEVLIHCSPIYKKNLRAKLGKT